LKPQSEKQKEKEKEKEDKLRPPEKLNCKKTLQPKFPFRGTGGNFPLQGDRGFKKKSRDCPGLL
jgi:hypothetical protein